MAWGKRVGQWTGLMAAPGLALAADSPEALQARYKAEVLPLVENYCYDCHADGIKKGELQLDHYNTVEQMQAHREVWKRVRDHLKQKLMPPLDKDQPTDGERKELLDWIDAAVFPVDAAHPDPGHVTLRRLNRVEYQNTMRDLLGVPVDVMDLLPPDDAGYGFDNIGDVLTISPTHMERYLEAARVVLDRAVTTGPMAPPVETTRGINLEGAGERYAEGKMLITNGEVSVPCNALAPGLFRITVMACGTLGADGPPKMELRLDGAVQHVWDVDAPMEHAREYRVDFRIGKAGSQNLQLAFTNDFWDEKQPNPALRDRNLMITSVRLEGPLDSASLPKPPSHRRIFVDRKDGETDDAYALRVLGGFARRAFRRPIAEGEMQRYLTLVALAKSQGDSNEQGIRFALEAMLVSPDFLYREEARPEPGKDKGIHAIDDHSLAVRLSYFLWSTMPDQELSDLADRGELHNQLDAQIERMVASPRSKQFVQNFAGQWLRLRDVDGTSPAAKGFDSGLKGAMRKETEMLFECVMRDNLPLTTLLDADFTFLNGPLAKHYGIPGVEGPEFRRVTLPDSRRRGLLGQGSFQLLTSYPKRTSPVLRGKYVLENLLDAAPPPPPPNIPQLDQPTHGGEKPSLREQMERHRKDPACAACHALMDPIGFGLENFDATGAWRDEENGKPIDTSGQFLDGQKFEGVEQLRNLLVTDYRSEFHRTVASRMLTYALGRGLDWFDKPALDRIVSETEAAGGDSHAMLRAVIRSVPFQYRRGDG
jgi:hypothetical protein